jgi:hypothetical protein
MVLMNKIGIEYCSAMPKDKFQDARTQIKHFIQYDGELVTKDKYLHFEDYCRQVFEKYLPEVV